MLRRVRVPQSLVLGLAFLLASAGCSNMPTRPLTQRDSASGTGSAPAQVLGLLDGGTSSANSKTVVVGLLGGVVSVGDFTVVIPPLALTRTATVTVSQPDLAHPIVNLSIAPASANKFLLPVLLVANAKHMDRSLLSVACMSYYNPTTGNWENLASTISLLNLTITTPLSHFSTYRVTSGGKAGW